MSAQPEVPTTVTGGEGEDLGFALPPPAKASRIGVLIGLVVVVGGALTFGYLRYRHAHGNPVVVEPPRVVRVETVKPTALTSDRALSLPGTVRPLEETQIYARTTGYVRAWHADLGDKVKEGQLLAELDTPDLAAQLSQARAQLAAARATVKQATAQRDYSKSNSSRYEGLANQNLVSKGQVEETQAKAATDEATLSAAESTVAAMEANVRRLVELQGFAKIVAPFAGTITTRSIERGALVREGGTAPLFTLVATAPVRIFIDVPQSVATAVKPETPATIRVREYGDKKFAGKVARAAGALDNELHTMTTEIRVPNPDGALLPGMYVQVELELTTPHRVLEVPATALYADDKGTRLAVVDAGGKIRFTKITIERDTGATVQIAGGLTGEEKIVKIAVPTLEDGSIVEVAK